MDAILKNGGVPRKGNAGDVAHTDIQKILERIATHVSVGLQLLIMVQNIPTKRKVVASTG